MGWYAKDRAVERIARVAGQGLDLVGFWDQARDALAPAIPHHLTPCWYTLDPASLLVTSHYDHRMIPELPNEWLAHEYRGNDCHKLADIARAKVGLSTLHEVTGGDPSRSPRWRRYVKPAPDQPQFSPEECALLQTVAPHLAEGARRGLLVGEATEPEQPEAPAWWCSPRASSRTRSPPRSLGAGRRGTVASRAVPRAPVLRAPEPGRRCWQPALHVCADRGELVDRPADEQREHLVVGVASSTSNPSRASSIAVAAPAQRAPTTIAS